MYFFDLAPKTSIVLTFSLALIGSSISTFFTISNKHPTKKWAIACNLEILVFILPLILVGNLIGRKLNYVLSEEMLLIVFMLVLCFNAVKIFMQLIRVCKQEKKAAV